MSIKDGFKFGVGFAVGSLVVQVALTGLVAITVKVLSMLVNR